MELHWAPYSCNIYFFTFWSNDKLKKYNVTLNHLCKQSYDRCKKSIGLQITNHVVHFKFGNMKKQQSPCNVVRTYLLQIVKCSQTSNSNYPQQSYLKPQTLNMFLNLAHIFVVWGGGGCFISFHGHKSC